MSKSLYIKKTMCIEHFFIGEKRPINNIYKNRKLIYNFQIFYTNNNEQS